MNRVGIALGSGEMWCFVKRPNAMYRLRSFLIVAALLVALPKYVAGQAQTPTTGSKTDEARVFLYRSPIEIYWDDWSGVAVSSRKASQVDVYIRGEGKTVDFDGVVSINCDSGSGFFWKTASNFGEPLDERGINESVPLIAVAHAKEIFCSH